MGRFHRLKLQPNEKPLPILKKLFLRYKLLPPSPITSLYLNILLILK